MKAASDAHHRPQPGHPADEERPGGSPALPGPGPSPAGADHAVHGTARSGRQSAPRQPHGSGLGQGAGGGCPEQALLGRSMVAGPGRAEGFIRQTCLAVRTGRTVHREIAHTAPDGAVTPFDFTASLEFRDVGGRSFPSSSRPATSASTRKISRPSSRVNDGSGPFLKTRPIPSSSTASPTANTWTRIQPA